MIARPKISRNEWEMAEIGAFEVGNFALLCCPVGDVAAGRGPHVEGAVAEGEDAVEGRTEARRRAAGRRRAADDAGGRAAVRAAAGAGARDDDTAGAVERELLVVRVEGGIVALQVEHDVDARAGDAEPDGVAEGFVGAERRAAGVRDVDARVGFERVEQRRRRAQVCSGCHGRRRAQVRRGCHGGEQRAEQESHAVLSFPENGSFVAPAAASARCCNLNEPLSSMMASTDAPPTSCRWRILATVIVVESVGGLMYAFGIYSARLKSKFSLSQQQLDAISISSSLGSNVGVHWGLLTDAAGPSAALCAALVAGGGGWLLLWSALGGVSGLRGLPWAYLCAFALLQGTAMCGSDVASMTTIAKAFPANRGRATGLVKAMVGLRAGQESEIPNFKGSYLGRFPLVLADFWTSDHLSERSRSVDAFSGTRARGTLTLKRR